MFVISKEDDDFWASEEEAAVPHQIAWISKTDLMNLSNWGEFDNFVSEADFFDFCLKIKAGHVMTEPEEMWLYDAPAEDRIEVLFEGTSFDFQGSPSVWASFDGRVTWITEPEYEAESCGPLYWDVPESGNVTAYHFSVRPKVKVQVF